MLHRVQPGLVGRGWELGKGKAQGDKSKKKNDAVVTVILIAYNCLGLYLLFGQLDMCYQFLSTS